MSMELKYVPKSLPLLSNVTIRLKSIQSVILPHPNWLPLFETTFSLLTISLDITIDPWFLNLSREQLVALPNHNMSSLFLDYVIHNFSDYQSVFADGSITFASAGNSFVFQEIGLACYSKLLKLGIPTILLVFQLNAGLLYKSLNIWIKSTRKTISLSQTPCHIY